MAPPVMAPPVMAPPVMAPPVMAPPQAQYEDEAVPLLPSQRLINYKSNNIRDTVAFINTKSDFNPKDLKKPGHSFVIEADTETELNNKLISLADMPGAATATAKFYALLFDTSIPVDRTRVHKAVAINLNARLASPAAPASAKAGSAWLWRIMLLGKGNYYKDQIDYVRSELYAV